MKFDQSLRIGIVGLGLMGGSYAQALSAKGFQVGAVDIDTEGLRFAEEKGWIFAGSSEVTAEFMGQFDLVVFALYPHTLLEWLDKYQSTLKPGTLLTDVTGVKGAVIDRVQAMLRPDVEFIGAHPMAGRESSGVKNAQSAVFNNANYIVVPTDKNSKEAIEVCMELGRTLGFGNVTQLTAEKHDEMIAFLSQLSHCLAVALMVCRDTTSLAEYSGDSFRDLTRIAKINDAMWSELFLLNKDQLIRQMDLFSKTFQELKNAIAEDDTETIREMMRLSTQRRVLFDKKE